MICSACQNAAGHTGGGRDFYSRKGAGFGDSSLFRVAATTFFVLFMTLVLMILLLGC